MGQARSSYWYHPVVVVLYTTVIYFVVQLASVIAVGPFFGVITDNNLQSLVYLSASTGVLVGLGLLLLRAFGTTHRQLGLVRPNLLDMLLVGPAFVVYAIVSSILNIAVGALFEGFRADQAQELGVSLGGEWWQLLSAFLALVVLTPIFEELLFRGVLYRGLRTRLNVWSSTLIASVLFGLAHLQWNVGIDTFVLGVFLCLLVERSKSLWPAIALHSTKNLLAFMLLVLDSYRIIDLF